MKQYICTDIHGDSWTSYDEKPNWTGGRFVLYGCKYTVTPYTGPNRPLPGQCVEYDMVPTNDLPSDDQIKIMQGIIDNKQEHIHELEERISELESERNALNIKLQQIPKPVGKLVDALMLAPLTREKQIALVLEIRNHYGVISRFEVGYEYKVEGEDHWWRVIHIEPDGFFAAVHVKTQKTGLFDVTGLCVTTRKENWKLSYTRRKANEATT